MHQIPGSIPEPKTQLLQTDGRNQKKSLWSQENPKPLSKEEQPLDKELKIQLYRAYVRSILTFSAPVRASATRCHMDKLQVVENYCLR